MAKPFPDMPYWGAFPAIGPIPRPTAADPATYATRPLSTGPYKIEEYTPEKSLTLVRNDEWDPATDPGRTPYPDGYDFDFAVPSEKIDEILLNDQGDAQTTMSYDDILGTNYREVPGARRRTGSSPAPRRAPATGRRTTARSPTSRSVRRWRLAYPYPVGDQGRWPDRGRQPLPGRRT